MPEFKFDEQSAYSKLIGKNALMFIKKSFTLTEIEIIEITQHRIRVKVLQKNNIVPVGVRKSDVVLLPISTSKKRLNNLIKTVNNSRDNLDNYLDHYAFKLNK